MSLNSKKMIKKIFLSIITLAFISGCATPPPKRVYTATSLPQVPFLPMSTGKNSEKDQAANRPFVLGGGFSQGEAVNDSGDIAPSNNFQGGLAFRLNPALALGGSVFVSDNRGMVGEDPLSSGLSVFSSISLSEDDSSAYRLYPTIRYSTNSNDATNCDQWGTNQAKDGNNQCIVTWHSKAQATLTQFGFSFLATKKWNSFFWNSLAPGIIYEKFSSYNHIDTVATDDTINKSKMFPTITLFTHLVMRSGAQFQIGTGYTKMIEYGQRTGTKHLFLLDLTLNF